jgi:hypothetical protein
MQFEEIENNTFQVRREIKVNGEMKNERAECWGSR